jgi:hypothetical protein
VSALNPRIALLGVVTVGAVAALIAVATGGDGDTPRKPSRARPEVTSPRKSDLAGKAGPETEAAEPGEGASPEMVKAPLGGRAATPSAPPTPRGAAVAPGRPAPVLVPGPTEKAMAELNQAYEAWMKSDENRFAKPESYGLDCRPPVCMLGAKYDSLEDGRFFDRSEAFFKARPELGHLISFPHRMDERHSRSWFFFNPYEPGTAEHHQFNLAAVERIKEELKDIPEYYPVPRPGYER